VEFRILGPVEFWAEGNRHDLGSRKERCVLAVLLWENGRPVEARTLIDKVWGDSRPDKALSSLYSNVSRLRATLQRVSGDGREWRLRRQVGTYALDVSCDDVDLFQFRKLRDEARAASVRGDDSTAFALLSEAELLWRGVPLTGIDGAWVERVRLRLEEERYTAGLDRLRAGLRLGLYADLAGEAAELAARQPLDERPVEFLMCALFMSGRRANALGAYRDFRTRYTEATGNEPSADLRELHQRMLQGAPEFDTKQPDQPTPQSALASILPRDNPDFTGRAAELDRLSGWLTDGQARLNVPVIAISGMAGVGKTALAVHAARAHEDRYPDQLYVELRRHTPDEDPMDPGMALGILLRAMGLPDAVIPAGVEDRAGLWRSRLAGKRALILLDDAFDSAQVRPLLPGAPGCLVLITTRHKVLDLPGMRWLSLEPMPPTDAGALFARAAARDQIDDLEVASVLRLCDYLPLEIQLAGSRLRRHPSWGVGDLATRLRQVHAEDRPVGAALALSYHYLTAAQQRLLRQLALHPGMDFSRHVAVGLADDESLAQTSDALDALADYHLIEEPAADRFTFHDLVRDYARHLAYTQETDDDRCLTVTRIVDYYIWLADSADRIVYPFRRRFSGPAVPVPVHRPLLQTPGDCREWIAAEWRNMLATAHYATAHDLSERASLLAHALAWFLDTTSCWTDAVDLHRLAVDAWRATGNAGGEATALADLCRVLGRIGNYEEAADCARQGLAIARTTADHALEAEILDSLGLILWQTSCFPEALSHFDQALDTWRSLGDRHGEADALGHSATVLWHINQYGDAVLRTEQALGIYREMGDLRGQANALNNLGDLQLGFEHHEQALDSYQQALEIYQSIGDRLGQATALSNIGDIYRKTGRGREALAYHRTALATCRDIGNRRYEADVLYNLGAAYQQQGYFDDALDQYQKALVLAHDLAARFLEARSHRGSGEAQLATGNHASAADSYRAALEISQSIGDRYQEAKSLDGLGQALLRAEGVTAVQELWHQAVSIFTSIGKQREAETLRTRLRDLNNTAA
jgi:tetratricopeptide (TPR) repeat protein/DNA-binding SARP family transcriptional activator